VPDGSIGGGIWSSAATESGNSVFVTTGNGDPDDPNNQGDSVSIVRLNGTTLARTDIWTVPPPQLVQDSDFGGSPTLFTATIDGTPTKMVGACNKNSIYYAWNRNDLAAGPVWQDQIGTPHSPGGQSGLCLSAAAWDGTHLFESGPQTMIDDVTYRGSIREIDPATGSYLWETGLSGGILTSPALDGAGVLAVGSWDFVNPNEVWLLDASNGEVLTQIDLGTSQLFSQPVFAGNYLLVASRSAGLMAYATP
jgi:hypothetical protein